ncbi:glycosyltransferase family 2 protein [Rufibacter immobilis]|uniref:Glycosyltransferase family 2 protein n=1 Tax=Rufibacter immobilis TaxID=1348778 RepID=A0A3M9MX53_9BACT|nr:glycosyltransferase family 2 protein [Rufibacter immobilis]RNI29453.1 glycosyltransferase family 2 protein [Rufibacter immobilis]
MINKLAARLKHLHLVDRLKNLFSKDFTEIINPPQPSARFYVSVCCIAKDENEYLEEWINYHLKVGVEHFYLYDNDSKVPLKETLAKAGLLKHATVIRTVGRAKQNKAYLHCLKMYGGTSRWIGFIDADEFIVPKAPKGDLPAFLKVYEPYGGVGVNWMFFGSSGHRNRTQRPLLESFLLRSEESYDNNRHIKSIVQPAFVQGILNSHSFAYKPNAFCVNENFTPIEGAFSEVSVAKIQLNHYYCRSFEEYAEKIRRGNADSFRKRSMEHFYLHDKDCNKVRDTTILDLFSS